MVLWLGILLLQLFMRACGISAAWLTVSALERWQCYLPASDHRAPALLVQDGGGLSFACAIFDFVGVGCCCGPCLGCLTSRIPSGEVPLRVFMSVLVLYPVSVPVASAVAARQDNARFLLIALGSVAKVVVFPSSVVFALVLGNSVRAWGIFALVLYIPWLLCWCGHFAPSACPALRASPAVAGLAYFHCVSHPMWCLHGVVFSELVYSYAVELCLWGLRCLWCSASFPPWLLVRFFGVFLSSCYALGRSWLCLLLGFYAVLFLLRLRFCAAPPTAGYPSGFLHLFWLRLPALLLCWWRWLVSSPFPCVLNASPAPAALPMVAGGRTMYRDSAMRVVPSLYLAVWWCLRVPQAFRALFVVWSGFPSSPPPVLSLCGCGVLFSFWFPLLQGRCASGLQ